MLIPAFLLNLAAITLFITIVSFSGLMIWRERKHPYNITTVRSTTTSSLKPTEPTMSPSTPTDPTMSPTTSTGPTMSPSTPTGPTMCPPTLTDPTMCPPTLTDPTMSPSTPTGPTMSPSTATDPRMSPTTSTGPTMSPSTPTEPTMSPLTPTQPTTSPLTSPGLTTSPMMPTGPTMSPPTPTRPSTPTTAPPHTTVTLPPDPTKTPKPQQVCETEACLFADEELKRKVVPRLNPCNDFYQFACSKMESEHDIALTKLSIDERYNEMLKELRPDDIEPVKLAKRLYKSCLTGGTKHFHGIKDVLAIVRKLSEITDTSLLLKRYYELALDFGYLPRSLFVIDVVQHPRRRDEKIIFIRKPSPSSNFYAWPLDTITSMDINDLTQWVKKYKLVVYEQYIHSNEAEWQEKEIEEAYSKKVRDTEEPTEISLGVLASTVKGIPWEGIIRRVFRPTTIPPDVKVMVECLSCLLKISASKVLSNRGSLEAYLVRHGFADNILDTSEKGIKEWFNDQAEKTGLKERYKTLFCTSKIVSLFKKAVDYGYIKKYLDLEKNDPLEKMIVQLRASLKNLVMGAKHLDESLKKKHLNEVDSLRFYTPLDEAMNDQNAVMEYYSDLPVNETDPLTYIQMLQKLRKYGIENTAKELFKNTSIPIKAPHYMFGEKFMHYDGEIHSIYVSVGALHDIIFSTDRSEFLNFGALGSIIGYGLSQSVSSKGSSWARKQQLVDSGDKKQEDERRQCFIESFKKDSNSTTNEMQESAIVFENDGVQIAYYAYMSARAGLEDQQDRLLPSFTNYTDGEMFYMSYASMACSRDAEPTKEEDYIPPYTKVNEVAKTNIDFDHEFKCITIPTAKCNLWLELLRK